MTSIPSVVKFIKICMDNGFFPLILSGTWWALSNLFLSLSSEQLPCVSPLIDLPFSPFLSEASSNQLWDSGMNSVIFSTFLAFLIFVLSYIEAKPDLPILQLKFTTSAVMLYF